MAQASMGATLLRYPMPTGQFRVPPKWVSAIMFDLTDAFLGGAAPKTGATLFRGLLAKSPPSPPARAVALNGARHTHT